MASLSSSIGYTATEMISMRVISSCVEARDLNYLYIFLSMDTICKKFLYMENPSGDELDELAKLIDAYELVRCTRMVPAGNIFDISRKASDSFFDIFNEINKNL
jgi:hypothetical protein